MSLSLDKHLGIHADAVTLRSQRSTMLANNMANVDTPGFKARDIDFSNLLQQAQTSQIKAKVTHGAHITMNSPVNPGTTLYRIPHKASLDGNTVDMDIERGEFTENAVRYQASLEFLNKKITGLIRVLRGE